MQLIVSRAATEAWIASIAWNPHRIASRCVRSTSHRPAPRRSLARLSSVSAPIISDWRRRRPRSVLALGRPSSGLTQQRRWRLLEIQHRTLPCSRPPSCVVRIILSPCFCINVMSSTPLPSSYWIHFHSSVADYIHCIGYSVHGMNSTFWQSSLSPSTALHISFN